MGPLVITTPRDFHAPVDVKGTVLIFATRDSLRCAELSAIMAENGWDCSEVHEADRAIWFVSVRRVQLIIVVASGDAALARLRSLREVSIAPMVLIGELTDAQANEAFDLGADLVAEEKIGTARLFAQMRALLRRVEATWRPAVRYLYSDPVRIDLFARIAWLEGEPIDLSRVEYDLLAFLLAHPQRALDAHIIVRRVWDWKYSEGLNTLRIHVGRLRKKLGDDPRSPLYIRSIRGLGYEWVKPVLEFGEEETNLNRSTAGAALLAYLQPLSEVLEDITSVGTIQAVGERVVRMAVAGGFSDGAALFGVNAKKSRLEPLAHAGMSSRWQATVADGLPLNSAFLGAYTVSSAQRSQYADLHEVRERFSATADLLTSDNVHSVLFLPLRSEDGVWGQLGFVNRARRPFSPGQTMYFSIIANLLEMQFRSTQRGCARSNPTL